MPAFIVPFADVLRRARSDRSASGPLATLNDAAAFGILATATAVQATLSVIEADAGRQGKRLSASQRHCLLSSWLMSYRPVNVMNAAKKKNGF